jgi:hypothetical protein
MSRFNMFMHMIGIECLDAIVVLTNIQLHEKGRKATTRQEILKFFGVCILATRFEFGKRADLWSTHPRTKYHPAACFGSTGMSRDRFDHLYTSI